MLPFQDSPLLCVSLKVEEERGGQRRTQHLDNGKATL
ncbi:unnamed protein product [Brassica rapa subsp. trilocularis]